MLSIFLLILSALTELSKIISRIFLLMGSSLMGAALRYLKNSGLQCYFNRFENFTYFG